MSKNFQRILGFLLLLLISFFVYKAGQWTIEKQARYTVVFPLAIVMVTLLGNRWLTQKQSIESTTHVNRAELYADVTEFLVDALMNSSKRSEDEQENFIVTRARELTPRLIAYASNDVLKKWTSVTNFGLEPTHPEGEKSPETDILVILGADYKE